MPHFERHVFVCTNERAADHPRGSCQHRGGVGVRDALKQQLTTIGLGKRVRANSAGCLDQCEHGVSMVVYPEQVWYGGVTEADLPEIIASHLVGGVPVARLLMPAQRPIPPLPALTPLPEPAT